MSKETHEAKKAAIATINSMAKIGGGRITADALVAAARDPQNPLHQYFEWDDTEAAEKYRLLQARALIRQCRLVITVESRKVPIPMYVRDPDVDSMVQGYVEVARIRTDTDAAHETLTREFGRAAKLLSRARKLATYFDLTAEFEDLEERMVKIRSRLDDLGSAPLNS